MPHIAGQHDLHAAGCDNYLLLKWLGPKVHVLCKLDKMHQPYSTESFCVIASLSSALCIVCMSVTLGGTLVLLWHTARYCTSNVKQAHSVHAQGAARKSYTSKTEIKKDALKKAMRMNQLG